MKTNKVRLMRLICMVLGALGVTGVVAEEAKTVKSPRVCFVAGKNSHGRGAHAHGPGLQFLVDELAKHAPEIETVIHKGGWPEDPAFFDGADAIVIYCDGGANHIVMPHLEQVDAMMSKGVGLACIHYGVEVPKGNAGDLMLKWTGGYFEMNWSVNPHWTASFTSFPDHPVARGLTPFELHDEWYFHMRFPELMKDVTPLLTAVPPLSTLSRPDGPHSGNPTVRKEVEEGKPQHVAWAIQRPDGGRGFGTTGGHFHKSWGEDNFRILVLNAIVWIAKGEVPAGGVPSPTPSAEHLESYLDK